ncbi:MAG: alpha/beta fold hydrolase [Saccharospirillum sp.]|uniref:alpha/beta fold hydrolase n=1 Tax=Saccharospirillum sp. TaxID=2033801 RepID=UPI00329995DA
MTLTITTLGELTLWSEGQALKLPASKRTRALLAYLAITNRPHRRDRLCEVFWDLPDDPRATLRWSLSKLRPLINRGATERLQADRERVSLSMTDVELDIRRLASAIEAPDIAADVLESMHRQLAEPFLNGIDLPGQPLFQNWLTSERQDILRLQGKVLARLASHPSVPRETQLSHARAWGELEPFSPAAANRTLTLLGLLGRPMEVARLTDTLKTRFRNAGIQWTAEAAQSRRLETESISQELTRREMLSRQNVAFCQAVDGVRIAHASVGKGTPIIKAANWLSHLEYDWDAPIWSPLFRELAMHHQFIRYDERGNGLSDWEVDNLSFEAFVTDLESVVEANNVDKFALLGISQGAAVSIDYAVKHPDRVTHLILFGGYPAGWRINATESEVQEREAVMTLTKTGWGRDNPAYRQIFSSTFMPSASSKELTWFNEFQRLTTSPENAVRFLSVFGDIDVREQLARVTVPTLVIHSLGDRRIPVSVGRDIAAAIPNAEFVGLESDGHLLLGREAASKAFVDAVREFIQRH